MPNRFKVPRDMETIHELLDVASLRVRHEDRTKKMIADLEACLRLFNAGKLSTPSERRVRNGDPWHKPGPVEMRALLDCQPVNVICTSRYRVKALGMFPNLRSLVLVPRHDLLQYRGVGPKWVAMVDKELRRLGLHIGMTVEELEALCADK